MPALNDIMGFDHVVQVHEDGTVTDAPLDIAAPELHDEELQQPRVGGEWELLSGYTGQHGYRGPIMHNSEFIGGRMADDILATPGYYVSLVNYSEESDGTDYVDTSEGWAVAYRPSE